MIFETKTITLKDGRTAILRAATEADAAPAVEWLRQTAGETDFILRVPEEVTMTPEQEANFFQRVAESPYDMMIWCEVDGELAGNCHLSFHNKIKTRHRCSVAIGLTKKFWNLGIGSAMFREMIAVAEQKEGVTQMELEFIEGNSRARGLYEKMGFRIAGVHPDAIRQEDGKLLALYIMQKKLEKETDENC